MPYLLDANVFMAASRLHYGLDFCPAFWEWLVETNKDSRVFSIERVASEVQAGDDALAEWASNRGSEFFLKPDVALQPALFQAQAAPEPSRSPGDECRPRPGGG